MRLLSVGFGVISGSANHARHALCPLILRSAAMELNNVRTTSFNMKAPAVDHPARLAGASPAAAMTRRRAG
jgi:hypothetical protein